MASIFAKRRQAAEDARLQRSVRETAAKLKRAERDFGSYFRAEQYEPAVAAAELIATLSAGQLAVLDGFERETDAIGGAFDPENQAMKLFAPLGPSAFLAGAQACSGRERDALSSARAYVQNAEELLGVPGLPDDFFEEVGPTIRSHQAFLSQAAAGGTSIAEWREWMLTFLDEIGM